MITRNDNIEKNIVNWVNNGGVVLEDMWDMGIRLNAIAELYRATYDDAFLKLLTAELDKAMDDKGNILNEKGMAIETGSIDISNLMVGNALYIAYVATKEQKYMDAAVKLAAQLNIQPRADKGYFLGENESKSLCTAFCSQKFYMNYETKNGGKERYNDVIAQYNGINADLYDTTKQTAKDDNTALESMMYYAASLIDTMEVMEQPLYEIFRKMQDYFKATVKDIIQIKTENADSEILSQDLIFAYSVLKGCRMKALHTEKYEQVALDILEQVQSEEAFEEDVTYVSAYILAYAESIKNREYQDYGRGKGGVLWS